MTSITQVISSMPTPPSRSQTPAAFIANADATVAATANLVSQLNTLSVQINTVSSEMAVSAASTASSSGAATSAAAAAASSATTAAANTQAPKWVSGTTYVEGFVVYSPATRRTYRRKVAGAGTTDPSADTTNWGATLLDITTDLPKIRPTLSLDFANSQMLDPRITFTRTSSATRVNQFGVIEAVATGVPRLEYDPITLACKGLLIEEQRTNLRTYSDVIVASTGTTVTSDAATAPDGSTGFDLLTETAIAGEHYAGDLSYAVTAGTTYTWSVFVKDGPSANRNLYLRIAGASLAVAIFNPITKIMTGSTGAQYISSGTQEFPNGVTRVWITYTAATSVSVSHRFQLMSGSNATYTGDGTSGLYLWGAQLEVGAYPTSYIPTAASQVTRIGDVAVMTGGNFSSWYRQSEGSFVVETDVTYSPPNAFTLLFSAASSNDSIRFRNWSGTRTNRNLETFVGGSIQAASEIVGPFDGLHKFSGAYRADGLQSSADGALSASAVVASLLPAVDRLYIGSNFAAMQCNGCIRSITYYPTRLANATLQALTQ